jgi:hypothetical protein
MKYLDDQRAIFLANREQLRNQKQADMARLEKEANEYERDQENKKRDKLAELAIRASEEKRDEEDKRNELDRRVGENVRNKQTLRTKDASVVAKLKNAKNCDVTSQSDAKDRHDAIQEEKAKLKKEEEEKAKNITPENPNGGSRPRRKNKIMK